jgi:hypothetical protein
MSCPFLVLYTQGSGVEALTAYLQVHQSITVMPTQFDRQRATDVVPVPEEKRIHAVERRWQRYEKPHRKAFGIALRIAAEGGQLDPHSAFMDVLLRYQPKVIVLRQDHMLMQAVMRLSERQGGGKALFGLPELRQALQSVKRDYEYLDEVAARFGPVLEIAREDLQDYGESLMQSVERWLLLSAQPYAPPTDTVLAMPELRQLAENEGPVNRLAERLQSA